MTDSQTEEAGMIPDTRQRVLSHTAEQVNERIRRQTEANVAYYAKHPERIDERLRELDAEWDIERALEANAATLAFGGTLLGALVNRRWLLLPGVVTGFLLQHAIQGWCPPIPIMRRLGIRTVAEIDTERYALKALRGDFAKAADGSGRPASERVEDALDAVRS